MTETAGIPEKAPDVVVAHHGGDRFGASIRGHEVLVDQPVAAGGEDTAPTPTELFVASLATCVGFYARRYLARHDLPTDGLSVDAWFELGGRPAQVTTFVVRLHVPAGVPEERRAPLLAMASHCTIHNTLLNPPHVDIALV
ncbi:MAG: OsmC family protein [Dermatophilaceae bacterium]|jgi:uncharacterized OsmC-like protein